MSKEVEITYLVTNVEDLEKKLLALGGKLISQKVLSRDIYQNHGDYFFRVSYEDADGQLSHYLTLKSEGNPNSVGEIKEKIEIENEFAENQIVTLIEMIKLMGFQKANSYKKTRKSYTVLGCDCDLDLMNGKAYLEIEFSDKNRLDAIVANIKEYIIEEN